MSANAWTDYKYQDLSHDEIRLLELDIDGSQLTGTLRRWRMLDTDYSQFRTTPDYWALSHHWDPAPGTEAEFQSLPILLLHDPEHPDRQLYRLRLRKSLAQALQAIRNRATRLHTEGMLEKCHLWIDAICIDQSSDEDKEKQLGRMGYIYNKAGTVIVWLGLLDDSLRNGIKFVRKLQNLHQLEDFLSNDRHQDGWLGLTMLSRNPWFQRLWIVQEITSAMNAVLLAEEEEVNWADFESAWSIFVSQFERVRTMLAKTGFFAKVRNPFGEIKLSAANILVDMRSSVLRRSQTGKIAEHLMTLEHLLTSLAMFEVTEPRDVVYAVLWLSSDAGLEAKHGSSIRHEYLDRTPEIRRFCGSERAPSQAAEATDDTGHSSQSLSVNGNGHHRARALSISASLLEMPATVLEHRQVYESAEAPIIVTNYKQPVFELCKQVLLHIIHRTKRLDIICFRWAPCPSEADEKHPSWLLSTKRDRYRHSMATEASGHSRVAPPIMRNEARPLIGKPGSNRRPYLACGRTRASAEYVRIEGRVLRVIGWKIGQIEEDAGEALKAVVPWKWRCVLGWKRNDTLPPDEFWRTLVADKGPDDQSPPIRFRSICQWAFGLGAPTEVDCTDDDEDNAADGYDRDLDLKEIRNEGNTHEVLKEFLDCAIATVWKRKLFKTKSCPQSNGSSLDSAFFGLGPTTLARGDIVAVLLGCAVPVILRPRHAGHDGSVSDEPAISVSTPTDQPPFATKSTMDNNNTRKKRKPAPIKIEPSVEDCEFVGECYVHGMMNGEILNWADTHGRSVMDFNLH